ncbi:hypothetical protein [Pseudomonas sp. PH1b]|uniref:hypothetical protein n=1 Tax=Pseudomonas sp. PH1b TaxID=1397282 RepID=UPI000469AFE7|nr:hypothetical protein [Pseudomonas sp. PH1b]
MPEIKERPILFSAPMVRAILEGQKTVTRRPMKVQPVLKGKLWEVYGAGWGDGMTSVPAMPGHSLSSNCPYGRRGDRLWVRESLGYDCEYGHYFAAGGKHGETVYLCSLFDDEGAQTGPSYDGLLPERSVPSIHLHRHYSRILLEITDVRVERLQEITPSQCIAEGAWRIEDKALGRGHEAVAAFKDLWQSTGGDWDANPWVWAVEFRRVQP